jgi:membrane protein
MTQFVDLRPREVAGTLMDISGRQSKLVCVKFLRAAWRVIRRLVWETATDNTTGLAAQMAYTLFFALAPVLLFLWHLLGLFGTDPAKLHGIFGVLKSFLPPDPKVQEVLDAAAASIVVTGSSGLLANIGILMGIYFGTIFIATISKALSHTYGVKEPRNWWSKYIISFLLLFWFGIVILICFNAVVFGETLAGVAEVNFQLKVPLQVWVTYLNLPLTLVSLIGLALVLYLLTPENYLTILQALPGAIFFSIGWITVTKLFQLYVARYSRYDATYLALASIIILLTWMYLTCLFLLLGGKLNAILRRERERDRRIGASEAAVQPA